MVSSSTLGVQVSVDTEYQPDYSNPSQQNYVFTYRVKITNMGSTTLRLERRHWFVGDAYGDIKEVEGEGVVGRRPLLEPGESHEYVSGSIIPTPIGYMHGYYTMERVYDGSEIKVSIPYFRLIAPFINN